MSYLGPVSSASDWNLTGSRVSLETDHTLLFRFLLLLPRILLVSLASRSQPPVWAPSLGLTHKVSACSRAPPTAALSPMSALCPGDPMALNSISLLLSP